MLELIIIFLSAGLLAFIYFGYVFLQVHFLKKSIQSISSSLQLQLRHINDLLFYNPSFQAKIRKDFLDSKTLSQKLANIHIAMPSIKATNYKSYPKLYLDLLSYIHDFNQNYLRLNKLQKKFQYKLATTLLFKDYVRLKSLSST